MARYSTRIDPSNVKVCVTWNATYSKLTTCDEQGLIIVWMLHKGLWFEEMINNRHKSAVRDMKWTSDGQKICIIYADGAVIVGSVDGNRLWGKELDMGLQNVEWSPDGRRKAILIYVQPTLHLTTYTRILFVTAVGEVLIYDAQGKRLRAMTLPEGAEITPDSTGANSPTSGSKKKPAFLRDEKDDDDDDDSDDEVKGGEGKTGGRKRGEGKKGRVIFVDWYDGAEGLLHPQVPTLCIALDGGFVQLSRGVDDNAAPLVVDAHMRIRQAMLALSGVATAHLSKSGQSRELSVVKLYSPYGVPLRTLKVPGNGISSMAWEGGGLRIALAVDAYIYFANIRMDTQVCFWDLKAGEKRVKPHRNLKLVSGGGEHVCLVTGPDDRGRGGGGLRLAVQEPGMSLLSRNGHLTWASADAFKETSPFRDSDSATAIAMALKRTPGAGRERVVDPDNLASPACAPEAYGGPAGGDDESNSNPITDTLVSDTRQSMKVDGRFKMLLSKRWESHALKVENNIVILDGRSPGDTSKGAGRESLDNGPWASLERRDTWDMVWATDDPNQLAAMEKTKMVVFNNGEAEEPVPCTRNLCRLEGLEARTVDLDDIMAAPESPDRSVVVDVETGALVEARELITTDGLQEAYQAISKKPHPRLWKLLAQQALEVLDLNMAEKAFVMCGKNAFHGVRLVKRLGNISDRIRRRAEVYSYFDRHDEAENMLREIDRRDLTISLRERLGDWFRVVQLMKQGGGDDEQLCTAWGKIGAYYTERGKWGKAVQYFKQAKDLRMVAECYYRYETHILVGTLVPYHRILQSDVFPSFFRALVPFTPTRVSPSLPSPPAILCLRFLLRGEFSTLFTLCTHGLALSTRPGAEAREKLTLQEKLAYAGIRTPDLTSRRLRGYQYASLRELVDTLPHGATELAELGTMFESVGLGEDSVRALIRLGDHKGAIDSCIRLNHWRRCGAISHFRNTATTRNKFRLPPATVTNPKPAVLVDKAVALDRMKNEQVPPLLRILSSPCGLFSRAVDLAEKHDFPQIEALLVRHTGQLLQKGDPLQAVEVFRMAGKATDAALLLAKLAEDAGRRQVDPLRAKKLHVLAACEVERHRKIALGGTGASRQGRSAAEVAAATAATLNTLMATTSENAEDKRAAKVLDSAWRGAEAYHYYMLAQRQLYQGKVDKAVRTAIRAFVKLEILPNQSTEQLEAAQALALKIFTRNPPIDPEPLESHCLECLDEGRSYQACTVSGQVISSRGRALMCKTCRHFAIESELERRAQCPLCHAPMR
ncbi:unnamed protein product [Ectocarpus sp. CCAP 1310/34]|nr:unnamed protein product [Ectocarpus sp. CCAP 1310/34]